MDSRAALSVDQETGPLPFTLRLVASPAPERDVSAAEVWERICSATLRIDGQRTADDHVLVALEEQPPHEPALEGKRRQLIELLLEGRTAKYAALELGVAASTVSSYLKRALSQLGLAPRLSAIPVYLSQLSNAARRHQTLRVREGRFGAGESGYLTLALPRYDAWLREKLSPGELEVCRLLLGGSSYEQMAAARGTTPRTIANQLCSVFAKLGASGRLQLVAKVASGTAA